MKRSTPLLMVLIGMVLITSCGDSGSGDESAGSTPTPDQPYAGYQARDIRALSDEQTEDLLSGRGAGYALAAELNSYPGPTHVLELAEQLELTEEQEHRVREIFTIMQEEAQGLGKTFVDLEAELDERFRDKRVNETDLDDLTLEIASVEGQLRATHLGAHLELTSVLTAEQITKYDELRGYTDSSEPHQTDDSEHDGHGDHS